MVNPEQQLSKKQIKRLASKVRLIKFVIYGLVILAFSALNFLVIDILSLFKLDSWVNAIGNAFLPILGVELLIFSSETMVNESKYLSKIVEKLISAEQYIHSFFAREYAIMPGEEHAALIFCGKRVSNVKIAKRYKGRPVTEIMIEAFVDNKAIKEFVLPKEITTLYSSAFYGCSNIESLSVEEGNPVFYSEGNCIIERETKEVVLGCKNSLIPDDAKSIGPGAFYGLESIVSMHLPSSVSAICEDAFAECVNLEEINLEYVTTIEENSFEGCTKLEKINISDDITYIGKDAFLKTGYYSKKENWKRGVLYIDKAIVNVKKKIQGCYRVAEGTLLIAGEAFYNCSILEGVSIPASVKYINKAAFNGCSNMSEISVDEDNAFYYSDSDCLILRDGNKLVRGCKYGCVSPKAVSIETEAFCEYNEIEEIIIPNGVKSLEARAFSSCGGIKRVSIPKSVFHMHNNAFCDCCNISKIEMDDNPTYKLKGKKVIKKDDGELVMCLDGVVPDGVASIHGQSFSSLNMDYIVIPKSVKAIKSALLLQIYGVKRIYYKGTKEEWNKVYINPKERDILKIDIYYNSEYKPHKGGKYWRYNQKGKIVVYGKKDK